MNLLITSLIIMSGLLFALAVILLYGLYNPDHDVNPKAYKWKKGMSNDELEDAVRRLVKKMTMKEKLNQLAGDWGRTGYIKLGVRFGLLKQYCIVYAGRDKKNEIQPIAFSDGPRGITVGRSTCFPVAMARAATWDTELEKRVGDAIGKEARAQHVNYFAGVCINLLRHPGWGRAQECYGEDPWLTGKMGVAVTNGVQRHNVMACAKHFALNSTENSRFYVDVQIDDRTLREVYLLHYQMVIDAGVASIMSAYNKVNGEYCGHNKWLLSDVLREEMGFEGFVSSDWIWGIYDGVKAVNAGMDMEMPMEMFSGNKLRKAVEKGALSRKAIDRCVSRILRIKLRFLSRNDLMEYSESLVACEAHRNLAREVAEKSMVLLKNDHQLLPLDKNKVKKISVVGKLSVSKNTGDKGSSFFNPRYVVTPFEGISDYLDGTADVVYTDASNTKELEETLSRADAVLVVAGYGPKEEGEYLINNQKAQRSREEVADKAGDRFDLTLLPDDVKMIERVSSMNEKTIVALVGGSAILCEQWKNKVPAILMAWYSGMEGGNALARILFGDVNPGGKLPFTVPVSEKQLPSFDPFSERVKYDYYHGYTLFDKEDLEPAFPFGFGLSYTAFTISAPIIEKQEIDEDGGIDVVVTVKNTGRVKGDEVVQLYVGFSHSVVNRPVKLLRGFKRVTLNPGETKEVLLKVKAKDVAWYNPNTRKWEIEKMEYEVYTGASSAKEDLKQATFRIR